MRTLALAALLLSLPAAAEEAHYRLYTGAQLGLTHVLGLTAVASTFHEGHQAWDVDLLWEPSLTLQSYSVGAAWHPLGGALFVGPRVRWLQVEAPWARTYVSTDNHLGLSAEVGGRWLLGEARKGMLSAGVGATYVPTESGTLRWMMGLNVGFAWGVVER